MTDDPYDPYDAIRELFNMPPSVTVDELKWIAEISDTMGEVYAGETVFFYPISTEEPELRPPTLRQKIKGQYVKWSQRFAHARAALRGDEGECEHYDCY